MFLLCLPPPKPSYKGIHKGGRPPKAAAPFVEAAEGRLLYMMAWEVASIAKTYRRISKYAPNMCPTSIPNNHIIFFMLDDNHHEVLAIESRP